MDKQKILSTYRAGECFIFKVAQEKKRGEEKYY